MRGGHAYNINTLLNRKIPDSRRLGLVRSNTERARRLRRRVTSQTLRTHYRSHSAARNPYYPVYSDAADPNFRRSVLWSTETLPLVADAQTECSALFQARNNKTPRALVLNLIYAAVEVQATSCGRSKIDVH